LPDLLETERLLFRQHEEGDLEAFCEVESDPVYRAPQSVHPRAELERNFREAWLVPKSFGLLATVLKAEARYIGRCGLYPLRNDGNEIVPGEASIAFYLARPYWGRGLATEAGRAFIDYGFGQMGLSRIVAGVNAKNAASIRVIEKLGFVWVRSGEGGGSSWHEYDACACLGVWKGPKRPKEPLGSACAVGEVD
jgi:[ribosomal protein S5]-alanine N-acetyltransferase